jgi:hypothetical protein
MTAPLHGIRSYLHKGADFVLTTVSLSPTRRARLRKVAADGSVSRRAGRIAFYVFARTAARLPGAGPMAILLGRVAPRQWRWIQERSVAYFALATAIDTPQRGRAGEWRRLHVPDTASTRPVTAAHIECRKLPAARTETALFVTHSPNGHLKAHVRAYLEALREEGIGIVLIVAADKGLADNPQWLYELVDGLLVRGNDGFDFAAWAHVLRLHGGLYRAETLYLLNDSVIIPAKGSTFHAAIQGVRSMPADMVGMTENFERGWHIQSYFLALKQRVLQSDAWHQFVMDVVSYDDKEAVINTYEVQLTPMIAAAGLTASALFKSKSPRNPTLYHWRELLSEGFPFIKIMTIRDEIPGVDRTGWRTVLEGFGFDVGIVDRALSGDTDEELQGSSGWAGSRG